MLIVLVSSTPSLAVAHYAVLTGRTDKKNIGDLSFHKYRKSIKVCVCVWGLEYVLGISRREIPSALLFCRFSSGGWVQFRPVRVRLVDGEAELLPDVDIIGNFASRLISEGVTSTFCRANENWRLVTGEIAGYPPPLNWARLYKIGWIFRDGGNFDLEF